MFQISNNHPLRVSILPDHLTPLTIANTTESMIESSDLVLTIRKLSMAIEAREDGEGMQLPKGEVDEELGVEDEVIVKTSVRAVILGGLVAPEMRVKEEVQTGEIKKFARLCDMGFCKLFLASIFRCRAVADLFFL